MVSQGGIARREEAEEARVRAMWPPVTQLRMMHDA